MAESYEYGGILQRMLGNVPNTVDKREGSVIYTLLAPVAMALAEQNYMLSHMQNLLFASTAEGIWLDRVVYDFGISRELATKSRRTIRTYGENGLMDIDDPIGKMFSVDGIVFSVIEQVVDNVGNAVTGTYEVECQTAGIIGNQYSGEILPMSNINGLIRTELDSDAVLAARDEETDEKLRQRFYTFVRQTPFGGNIAYYEKMALSVEGVGAVKVFSAKDMGAGNVGIVVAGEDGMSSEEVAAAVQSAAGTDGDGFGTIGHNVMVKTCVKRLIVVQATIQLKSGVSAEVVKPTVENAIREYINGIEFEDATVFHAQLIAAILNCDKNILDVSEAKIDGASANLLLDKTYEKYDVPKAGTVIVTVVTTE